MVMGVSFELSESTRRQTSHRCSGWTVGILYRISVSIKSLSGLDWFLFLFLVFATF